MLKELIDKFYMDQQKNRPQHHFYVSQAGKCPRQIFFKFKNAPAKEKPPRIMRIFERGEYLHRNIVSILIRLGIVVAAEINIPKQEIVSGRADAIVSLDNELYVLDIKSMNSMILNKITEPKEDNVRQLQLYLHFFKIKKGILLYVGKDKQNLKEFEVEYNPKIAELILSNFKELKEKIDNNIVPSRIPGYPESWQCKYCSFREVCDLGEGGKMKWKNLKKIIESQSQNA